MWWSQIFRILQLSCSRARSTNSSIRRKTHKSRPPFPPVNQPNHPKKKDFRFQQEKIESWDHPTQTFTQRQDTISSMPSSNSSSMSPARIISLFMELIDSCQVGENRWNLPRLFWGFSSTRKKWFGSGNSWHNFCLFDKLMLEIEGDIMVCGAGRMLVEFTEMLKTPVFAS